jgi:peptide/nickel transport system permease protein
MQIQFFLQGLKSELGWTIFETNPESLTFIQQIFLNVNPLIITMIIFSWMQYARITHTQVLSIKQKDYIKAARVVGVKSWRIIWRHIIPNTISPAIILVSRDIGRYVVLNASFTYIGLGGDLAWASILKIGSKWIIGPGGGLLNYWWVYLPITITIVLFGICWNLLGDELNRILNPQKQKYI